MFIKIPITTKNSKNRFNKKNKLNNSIYISRTIAKDKILKNIQIFKNTTSYQILGNKNSPVNNILIKI